MNDSKPRVLVTGATGFLGQRLVEVLIERGFWVRGLARVTSSVERIKAAGAEVVYGDVADVPSLGPAFRNVDVVVHAAADTSGSEHETRRSTIQGTTNVLGLCEEFKVRKLVYISSCNVYGVAEYDENKVVTEDSSLEQHPERRGFYSFGKFEAEKIVTEAMKRKTISLICLRPGTIFGAGGEIFTPMMGFSVRQKLFVIIGIGSFVLPLVYIDNLVDAIIKAIEKSAADGKIFNVVDPDSINKKEYVEALLKRLYPKANFLYLPYGLIFAAVSIQEYLFKLFGRAPFLTRYRLISSQKNVRYDSSRIMKDLDWRPPYRIEDAVGAVIAYGRKRSLFRQD